MVFTVIGIIIFLEFSLNNKKSINDFQKESESLIEKNECGAQFFYYAEILLNESNSVQILLKKDVSYIEWGKSKEKYYKTSEQICTEILKNHPNNTLAW